MKHPHRPGTQRGLGLIEIMVALAISVILMAGVIQILLSSKLSYRVSEANARVQEGGRFAIEFMNNDLRMAGHLGCFRYSFAEVDNILDEPDFNWNLETTIEGYDSTGTNWPPELSALIAGEVLGGTDVLVMRGLAGDGIPLVDPFSVGDQWFANTAGNINAGDVVMANSCGGGRIARITGIDDGAVPVELSIEGLGNPFGESPFGDGVEVSRIETHIYYIAANDAGVPALFRRSLTDGMSRQELVDGVEGLRILYGEDTNADGIANRYVRAQEATMSEVVSLRISLLLRTEDSIASTPQTYLYDGEEITAGDLRMRRVFSSTVKLRNRGVL